ncbi:MAG TPA: hypothetical protein VFC31_08815 [Candidatus Limnocylindria bacterium]|nr:hypothetical protein [Candidatus Limnocylindria bacterium]
MNEIEILGLFGATLRPCSVCDISDLGSKLEREQAAEATDAARADSDVAYRIAVAVFGRHGAAVRVRLTPIDSPRGMWLTLRHRLGGGPQVLVNGRKTAAEPERVLAALA